MHMDTSGTNTPPPDTSMLDHQWLDSLINAMADGVVASDENGNVALYNGAALNILDVNKIDKNQPIEQVLKLLDSNGSEVDTKAFIQGTTTQNITRDYQLMYSDGSLVHIYLSISPVRLSYGKRGAKGYVIIIRDITREKSLEEERDEFISVVSHELRTPAATIEGAISNAMLLLDKSTDVATIKESLQHAYAQSRYLEDMINDLSTLARAERGDVEKTIAAINPHTIAEGLLKNYLKSARDKGLDLHLDIDPSLELFTSIELYVREILQNFVTNAIKYTERGSVVVAAQAVQGGVTFSISDTGIGISKGDQALVFDKFFRSEDYHTRAQKGTGLGLHVTKKLAKIVNAQLSVTSKLGEGSTFSVFFPNLK